MDSMPAMFKVSVIREMELEYEIYESKINAYKRAEVNNQKGVLQFVGAAPFTGDLKASINSIIDRLYDDMNSTMKPIMIEVQAKDLNSGEITRYTKINEKTFGLGITENGSHPVEISRISTDYPLISSGRII